jgi:hypothetical protein
VEGRSALRRIIQDVQMPEQDVQMPETPTLTGDEAARVERGFLHLHSELSQGHVNLRELATTVLTLVDVLVAQGFVSIDELRAQAAYHNPGSPSAPKAAATPEKKD